MAEYTYEDIIMDPEDPRLEGAIGKVCYFSDYPKNALYYARNNSTVDRLKSINKESACPFVDEHKASWAVAIIKKEEPKKYVPFKDRDEFIEYYLLKATNLFKHKLESLGGIWLRYKEEDVLYMVTEIRRDGVITGSDQLSMDWDKLLEYFTFLDGSPCGKLAEEGQ